MTGRKRGRPADASPLDGLGEDIPVRELAPVVLPEMLRDGVVARYRHAEISGSNEWRGSQRIHTFQLGQDFAAKEFALWGALQLDQKLKTVDFGTIVFLQYLGKEQGDRAQHNWTVRPFSGTPDQLKKLIAKYRTGCENVALATEAPRAERKKGPRGEYEHTDMDAPPF